MSSYDDHAMRSKIAACVKKVTTILQNDRESKVQAAGSVPHRYSDKFLLVDTITNMTCASLVNCLAQIGLTKSVLKAMKNWPTSSSVTLRFSFMRKHTFLREEDREVEDPTKVETKSTWLGTETVRVVTKVKEFVYLEEQTHQLVAFTGVGDNEAEFLIILDHNGSTERSSTHRSEDYTKTETRDLSISWLLKTLSAEINSAEFGIDRSDADCFTPVRNNGCDEAREFMRQLNCPFCYYIDSAMQSWKSDQPKVPTVSVPALSFSPVVPLFEERHPAAVTTNSVALDSSSDVALSSTVINALLEEYNRSLVQMCSSVTEAWAELPVSPPLLYGAPEAKLQTVMVQIQKLCSEFASALRYVEGMIRHQLTSAIGKEIDTEDFAQYMTFHNRKVFKEAYQPKPFSYAVRRSPMHSPEGQIQIEVAGVSPATPICTVAQHVENAPLMEFALNATTTVKFGGERHLHGWMAHHFSSDEDLPELKLVAQARQFSSYIVLIGRIASAKLFQPKYGFVVQNKDEFCIPLELEQIPTAKEFKDAILSLSPEQQRFAKAFRSMQLESTLLGVCVIQIKPQLEKVLKLQADSLTKEIKLTQDLMQLFIKYQIPSDLLSFQGQQGGDELVAVKGHAQALQEVLLSAKEEEVAEAELRRGLKRGREEDSGSEEDEDDEEEESEEEESDSEEDEDENEEEGVEMVNHCAVRMSSGGKAPRKQLATKTARKSAPAVLVTRKSAPATERAPSLPSYCDHSPPEDCDSQVRESSDEVDFTVYPTKLEKMYTQYDPHASVRPAIINPGARWKKTSQAGLLSAPEKFKLNSKLQNAEKNAAFDLLDALTRSGALPIEHASLHVIIAATHCFDDSLMDTVVQKNVNPIERVERSTLIMAAALNSVPVTELVTSGQLERVATFSPMLFSPTEETDLLMNE